MDLDSKYYFEKLSVRAQNVCEDNNFYKIEDLLVYYQKYKNFKQIRSCGQLTNRELIEFCQYLLLKNEIKYRKENLFDGLILTTSQRKIVNSFIEINLLRLSNRSKKVITLFLSGNFKFKNLNDRILSNEKFNFKVIKNVGSKSETELKNFIDSVKEFIKKVVEIENEKDLIIIKSKFLLEKAFSTSSVPEEILESQSIFSLVDFLIKNDLLLKKNKNIIFQKSFKIYQNQLELSLDEISKELNYTREKCRIIRKDILDNLFNSLIIIRNIDDDLYQKYNIDKNQSLIIISEYMNKLINEVNKTNFSNEFNTFLIYTYLANEFDIIGEIDDVLLSNYFNSKERYNWKSFYLVSKHLTMQFDFNKFMTDIDNRMKYRNNETYFFPFKSYLNNFVKNDDISLLIKLFPVAEKIINQEFDLIIDRHDNIVFKRNTVKCVPEYAIEALERLGVPSKIEEIYKILELEQNEITKSPEALRGSLNRSPEIIYIGRSSTYGLKKWEIEKEGIRGGTIKDIIFEYLHYKTNPIHILELLNEVHKYREKTNARNVITNLKLDPQKQFIIFNQSFIGLSGKSYNSNLTSLPKFLGKTITNYVKQQKCANRITIEEYFSILLKISQGNMKYVIDYLIEQQFVYIDNQNNLYI